MVDYKRRTFEEWLEQYWRNEVSGTEDDCLDDDCPDAFDAWMEGLTNERLMRLADIYGSEQYCAGLQRMGEKALEACHAV